jgi:nucleotide-binding universal stress UspA family protein
MFTKVLVPLDRSPLAEQAIGRAAAIARATNATIDLLLVHEVFGTRFSGSPEADADILAGEHRYIERVAAELCEGASLTVTGGVHEGPTAATICERARETAADLIVMTSHGRVGLARMVLGSVADEVVRKSTTPILLLRAIETANDRRAAHHLFKHILVPLDGSEDAAAIIPAAIDLAHASVGGAAITLLRVVAPIPAIATFDATIPPAYTPIMPDEVPTARLVSIVAAELDEIAQRLHEEGHVAVESDVVVSESVGAAIAEYARGHGVDVVAMSTHGRGASRLVLGSVADKVLHDTGLPILLQRAIHAGGEHDLITEPSVVEQLPALSSWSVC